MATVRHLLTLVLLACGFPAHAQTPLGDAPVVEQIMAAKLDGYSISGLVSRLPERKAFKYGIVLFPGYPSIMRLRQENGETVFELRGNTLVRSRRLLVDTDTLVLTVDAPSDQWASFDQYFRLRPRYGKDIAALLAEVVKQYPVADWTLIGHSEGAVSAYGAAVANPDIAKRLVLVNALYIPTRNGAGLTGLNWDTLAGKLLFVHHADDPCQYTPYRSARAYAEKTGSPLLTVRGGSEGRGDSCNSWTAHGLPGMEQQAFTGIKTWITTGTAPASIGP